MINKMNLETLKKFFTELRDYLELHHDNSIINMLKLVKDTVNVLESDYDTRMKLNEPLERIRNDLWEIMNQYV